jgi:type IV pilus assembly protein PilB
MSDVKRDEEAPVIRIAYTIIQQAIVEGASEIMIEPSLEPPVPTEGSRTELAQAVLASAEWFHAQPGDPGLRVAYRVDGESQEQMSIPNYLREPITERFKQMADMDLACTNESQDGRIPIRWSDTDYLLLVHTTPTPEGEQVLMRFAETAGRGAKRLDS